MPVMAPFLAARARRPLIALQPTPRKTPCLHLVTTPLLAAPHLLLCPPSSHLQTRIQVLPTTLPPRRPLPLRTPPRRTLRLRPTPLAAATHLMAMGTRARARVPVPLPAAPQAQTQELSRRRRRRIRHIRSYHPARNPSPLLLRRPRLETTAATTATNNMVITPINSSSRMMTTMTRMTRATAPDVRRSGLQRRGPGTPEGRCVAATTGGAQGTTRSCTSDSPFSRHRRFLSRFGPEFTFFSFSPRLQSVTSLSLHSIQSYMHDASETLTGLCITLSRARGIDVPRYNCTHLLFATVTNATTHTCVGVKLCHYI